MAGFTIVEMAITSVLLGLLLVVMGHVARTGSQAYTTGVELTDLEGRARRVVERLASELVQAGVDTLVPLPSDTFGTSVLSYQIPRGYNGGPVWDVARELSFERDTGELDDGLDNDGDGLVDEGRVVWKRAAGLADEREAVWCSQVAEYLEGETPNGLDDNGNGLVDEAGLVFSKEGDALVIRVTLEAADSNGNRAVRTAETRVVLRN